MRFDLQTLTEYSDEAIIAELRRVADGLNGKRFTIQRFDSLARVHSSTVRTRFGSWAAALDRAGIDPKVAPRPKTLSRDVLIAAIKDYAAKNQQTAPTRDMIAAQLGFDQSTLVRRFGKWETLLTEVGLSPVPLGRRYTDEECFENVLALWTHYGRQPHFAELNQPPSTVGSKAYVRRWGGWRRALGAFVARANEPLPETESEVQGAAPSGSANVPTVSASPRSMSLALRYKVLLRDHFKCVTCGRSPATHFGVVLHVDHITPWSRGGQNIESNLRTLCFDCNLGKGGRAAEE